MRLIALAAAAALLAPALASAQTVPAMPTLDETPAQRTARRAAMTPPVHQEDAALQAAKIRLRPILMTSMTSILGLVPMAIGMGRGSEANIPLARAVVGGLLMSTLMVIVFVPVLYSLMKRPARLDSASRWEST